MSRKVLVGMQMTLDGIASLPDYPDLSPEAVGEFWETAWTGPWKDADTILLGRKTYEGWAAVFPGQLDNPDENVRRFARSSTQLEKVVFSRTLKSADWANSRIVRGPVAEEIARLRELPGRNMMVGGGTSFVQSVLAQSLADELYLVVYPSIVARGKPLFHLGLDPDQHQDVVPQGAPDRHDFRLLEARGLSSGAVFLHYAIPRRGTPED